MLFPEQTRQEHLKPIIITLLIYHKNTININDIILTSVVGKRKS